MGTFLNIFICLGITVLFGLPNLSLAQERDPVDVSLLQVIWDQPNNAPAYSAFYTFYYPPDSTSSFLADNFIIQHQTLIERITAYGRRPNQILTKEASSILSIRIFPDNNGKPKGNPADGLNSHLFALDIPTDDASIQFLESFDSRDSTIEINVSTFLEEPMILKPGVYWLCIYLDSRYLEYSWYWRFSSAKSHGAHMIDPYMRTLPQVGDWQNMSQRYQYYNLAFKVEGIIYE